MIKPAFFALAALLLLQACSEQPAEPAVQTASEQSAPQVAQTQASPISPSVRTIAEISTGLLDNMGGRAELEGISVLTMKGSGTRRHLGQVPATGAVDPTGMVSELTEVIDFANGSAGMDYVITIGDGFAQHRTDSYTLYEDTRLGWGTTEGRPNIVTSANGLFSWAVHNSPEWLLRRNPVSVALTIANAVPDTIVSERSLDGTSYWHVNTTLNDESLGLYIDQQTSQLKAFSAVDTETMWGDTISIYVLGDYRPVGSVVLPHSLEIRKDDGIYATVQYDSMLVNDSASLAVLAVPADVTGQADEVVAVEGAAWAPLQWNAVATNVNHAVAFSHHSMVVEFPSFVVVVEGAYTEAQSLTLARLIEENIGKPIRYAVPTHPHFDHTGGLRALASLGANMMVTAGHEGEIRRIIESPHTNPADELAKNVAEGATVGEVEVFTGMTEISEGDQKLQLFEVTGIPHVSPKVLAYVPSAGVLFQSDLFFGAPGSDATALYKAIQDLGLDVQQIVGGHGGVLAFQALEDAVNSPPPAAGTP
jgi:glyoxylase-like metal-dependent hydrolase (beta-lactamase superfamily II)